MIMTQTSYLLHIFNTDKCKQAALITITITITTTIIIIIIIIS